MQKIGGGIEESHVEWSRSYW